MSAAKTQAERVREHKARRIAAGFHRLAIWVHLDDLERVRAYVARLTKARQKQGGPTPPA